MKSRKLNTKIKKGVMRKSTDNNYFEFFSGIFKEALPSTSEFKKMKNDEKVLEEKKQLRNRE